MGCADKELGMEGEGCLNTGSWSVWLQWLDTELLNKCILDADFNYNH